MGSEKLLAKETDGENARLVAFPCCSLLVGILTVASYSISLVATSLMFSLSTSFFKQLPLLHVSFALQTKRGES